MSAEAMAPKQSNARRTLSETLEAIAAKRAEYQEVNAQQTRLRELLKAEADALAKLDAIKQNDAQALAEQLLSQTAPTAKLDHRKQSAAENELLRARRDADVARACQPAVAERAAAASAELAALEGRALRLAVEVMIEDARVMAAEIERDARRLRAKYAGLWSLRRYLGDTPAVLKRLEAAPQALHPDHVAPEIGELIAGAEAWRRYAARLVADPEARLEDKTA